jgi:hypothetical protein
VEFELLDMWILVAPLVFDIYVFISFDTIWKTMIFSIHMWISVSFTLVWFHSLLLNIISWKILYLICKHSLIGANYDLFVWRLITICLTIDLCVPWRLTVIPQHETLYVLLRCCSCVVLCIVIYWFSCATALKDFILLVCANI